MFAALLLAASYKNDQNKIILSLSCIFNRLKSFWIRYYFNCIMNYIHDEGTVFQYGSLHYLQRKLPLHATIGVNIAFNQYLLNTYI